MPPPRAGPLDDLSIADHHCAKNLMQEIKYFSEPWIQHLLRGMILAALLVENQLKPRVMELSKQSHDQYLLRAPAQHNVIDMHGEGVVTRCTPTNEPTINCCTINPPRLMCSHHIDGCLGYSTVGFRVAIRLSAVFRCWAAS